MFLFILERKNNGTNEEGVTRSNPPPPVVQNHLQLGLGLNGRAGAPGGLSSAWAFGLGHDPRPWD